MDTIPCSVYAGDVSLVVSGPRSSRAAISVFLGCFFGRYLILSMFECHIKFERIFDKISEYVKVAKSVDIAVPELAVTIHFFEKVSFMLAKVEEIPNGPILLFWYSPSVFSRNSVLRALRASKIFRHYATHQRHFFYKIETRKFETFFVLIFRNLFCLILVFEALMVTLVFVRSCGTDRTFFNTFQKNLFFGIVRLFCRKSFDRSMCTMCTPFVFEEVLGL